MADEIEHTRWSEGLDQILPPGSKPEKLAGGFEFTEGPVWVEAEGALLFSDIPADTIYRWSPEPGPTGQISVHRRPSGNSNGLTLDAQGRLIACEHGNRRVSRAEADGSVVSLADSYEGKRLNSPNDVVAAPDGAVYFTDPPYGLKDMKEGKELDFQGVYRLDPGGELRVVADDFIRPNGLCFSPDGRILYIDDSYYRHIRAFNVEPDGSLSGGRLFFTLNPHAGQPTADGMKVDVEGNLYVCGPGGVWVFAPDALPLGILRFPELPANIAWGGPDRRTLFATARTGLYRLQLSIPGAPLIPPAA